MYSMKKEKPFSKKNLISIVIQSTKIKKKKNII